MVNAVEDRDERLAVIFDRLLQDSQHGNGQQRLEEAIRLNPDLEQDLRELFATAQMAEDLAVLQSVSLSDTIRQPRRPRGSGSAMGTRVGEYEIQGEIGRGGMGVVYRAWQQSLQRTVALKMIPNAAFASTQDVARLRIEALAAARLQHPNIVPVYDVGEQDGQP